MQIGKNFFEIYEEAGFVNAKTELKGKMVVPSIEVQLSPELGRMYFCGRYLKTKEELSVYEGYLWDVIYENSNCGSMQAIEFVDGFHGLVAVGSSDGKKWLLKTREGYIYTEESPKVFLEKYNEKF